MDWAELIGPGSVGSRQTLSGQLSDLCSMPASEACVDGADGLGSRRWWLCGHPYTDSGALSLGVSPQKGSCQRSHSQFLAETTAAF